MVVVITGLVIAGLVPGLVVGFSAGLFFFAKSSAFFFSSASAFFVLPAPGLVLSGYPALHFFVLFFPTAVLSDVLLIAGFPE